MASMADVTLYGIGLSNYTRTCLLALEEKGVDYELVETMPQSEEALVHHPFGKIPSFAHRESHGETVIFETQGICTYIDAAFDGPALTPADPVEQARMAQWISCYNDYFDTPMIRDIVIQRVLVPRRGGETDEAVVAAAAERVAPYLAILDDALGASPYLAGGSYSLADMTFLPPVFIFQKMPEGRLLETHENIKAWLARGVERPATAKIFAE